MLTEGWYAGGTVERAEMAEQTPTPIDLDAVIDICGQNDIAFLGIFGSHARGEATPESDVDLLVRFARRKSLLTIVRIERQISERLGRPVDLVTEASLSPYLRERVQAEVESLYERIEMTICIYNIFGMPSRKPRNTYSMSMSRCFARVTSSRMALSDNCRSSVKRQDACLQSCARFTRTFLGRTSSACVTSSSTTTLALT